MAKFTTLSTRRFALWWELARKWFKSEHETIVERLDESASEISFVAAHLYDSDEDVNADDLFVHTTSDALIVVPSSIITKDGYIKKEEFELITGISFV